MNKENLERLVEDSKVKSEILQENIANLLYSFNMVEIFGWVSILTQPKYQNEQLFEDIPDIPLLEFLIGLGLKKDNSSLEKPSAQSIFYIVEAGKKFFNKYIFSEMDFSLIGGDPITNKILTLSLFHSLLYQSNTGRYPFQTDEYLHSFKPTVNNFFLTKYGFTINDAYKFSTAIIQAINKKVIRRFDIAHKKGRKYGFKSEIYNTFLFENSHRLMEISVNLFPYDEENITRFNSFLQVLSCTFGDGINDFKTPLDYNLFFNKPIIFFDNKYYCFIPNMLIQKMPSIIEFLLEEEKLANTKIWARFIENKSDYAEEKTIKVISKLFSTENIYQNLFYYPEKNARFEIDLLVKDGNSNIFFEIKSGIIKSYSRRKGINSIKTDLKKLVEDAFEQSNRVVTNLKNYGIIKFQNEKKQPILEITYNTEKTQLFQVSITLEPLFSNAINLSLFTTQGMFVTGEYPWTINIYELEIILDLIKNSTIFFHYIISRNKYLNLQRIESFDELSFFALYIKDTSLSIIKDDNEGIFIHLDPDLLDVFDLYYLYHESPPKLNIPKEIMQILDQMDQEKPNNYFLISQCILNLDSNIQFQLNERIFDGKKKVRKEKRSGAFLLFDPKTKIGFTIAIINNVDDVAVPLQERCSENLSKYSAENWIGISIIIQDLTSSYSEIICISKKPDSFQILRENKNPYLK
nr:hypothetical protein [uncultured Methanospirillum sp.]